uniref:Sterile alpha motif domain containing 13 n=2 Tax=Catharus TaxID=9184 RepID=A0A8C3TT43_CATUS
MHKGATDVLHTFSDYLSAFALCSSVENGRPVDPADWAVTDVVNYFRTAGFEEQANAFQEQEIDGKSLLLMTRNDVLTGLSLKLGPALKIYEYHVKPLQTQHLKNNSL